MSVLPLLKKYGFFIFLNMLNHVNFQMLNQPRVPRINPTLPQCTNSLYGQFRFANILLLFFVSMLTGNTSQYLSFHAIFLFLA